MNSFFLIGKSITAMYIKWVWHLHWIADSPTIGYSSHDTFYQSRISRFRIHCGRTTHGISHFPLVYQQTERQEMVCQDLIPRSWNDRREFPRLEIYQTSALLGFRGLKVSLIFHTQQALWRDVNRIYHIMRIRWMSESKTQSQSHSRPSR